MSTSKRGMEGKGGKECGVLIGILKAAFANAVEMDFVMMNLEKEESCV